MVVTHTLAKVTSSRTGNRRMDGGNCIC